MFSIIIIIIVGSLVQSGICITDEVQTPILKTITPPCFTCSTETVKTGGLCCDNPITFKYDCPENPCNPVPRNPAPNPCKPAPKPCKTTPKCGCAKNKIAEPAMLPVVASNLYDPVGQNHVPGFRYDTHQINGFPEKDRLQGFSPSPTTCPYDD